MTLSGSAGHLCILAVVAYGAIPACRPAAKPPAQTQIPTLNKLSELLEVQQRASSLTRGREIFRLNTPYRIYFLRFASQNELIDHLGRVLAKIDFAATEGRVFNDVAAVRVAIGPATLAGVRGVEYDLAQIVDTYAADAEAAHKGVQVTIGQAEQYLLDDLIGLKLIAMEQTSAKSVRRYRVLQPASLIAAAPGPEGAPADAGSATESPSDPALEDGQRNLIIHELVHALYRQEPQFAPAVRKIFDGRESGLTDGDRASIRQDLNEGIQPRREDLLISEFAAHGREGMLPSLETGKRVKVQASLNALVNRYLGLFLR